MNPAPPLLPVPPAGGPRSTAAAVAGPPTATIPGGMAMPAGRAGSDHACGDGCAAGSNDDNGGAASCGGGRNWASGKGPP